MIAVTVKDQANGQVVAPSHVMWGKVGGVTRGARVFWLLQRARRVWRALPTHLQRLVRKSFSNRAKAVSKASRLFQFEKAGMWYWRTSSAKASPVSESRLTHLRNLCIWSVFLKK